MSVVPGRLGRRRRRPNRRPSGAHFLPLLGVLLLLVSLLAPGWASVDVSPQPPAPARGSPGSESPASSGAALAVSAMANGDAPESLPEPAFDPFSFLVKYRQRYAPGFQPADVLRRPDQFGRYVRFRSAPPARSRQPANSMPALEYATRERLFPAGLRDFVQDLLHEHVPQWPGRPAGDPASTDATSGLAAARLAPAEGVPPQPGPAPGATVAGAGTIFPPNITAIIQADWHAPASLVDRSVLFTSKPSDHPINATNPDILAGWPFTGGWMAPLNLTQPLVPGRGPGEEPAPVPSPSAGPGETGAVPPSPGAGAGAGAGAGPPRLRGSHPSTWAFRNGTMVLSLETRHPDDWASDRTSDRAFVKGTLRMQDTVRLRVATPTVPMFGVHWPKLGVALLGSSFSSPVLSDHSAADLLHLLAPSAGLAADILSTFNSTLQPKHEFDPSWDVTRELRNFEFADRGEWQQNPSYFVLLLFQPVSLPAGVTPADVAAYERALANPTGRSASLPNDVTAGMLNARMIVLSPDRALVSLPAPALAVSSSHGRRQPVFHQHARTYALVLLVCSLVEYFVTARQMEALQTQARLSRVSPFMIWLQAALDISICFRHISAYPSVDSSMLLFALVTFVKLCQFLFFGVLFMQMTWTAGMLQHPGAPGLNDPQVRRESWNYMFTNFYMFAAFSLFFYYSSAEVFGLIYALVFHSFLFPQIFMNFTRGLRRPLTPAYMILVPLSRMVLPLYMWLIAVILVQHYVGPRFFWPAVLQRNTIKTYEYLQPPMDEEAAGPGGGAQVECGICLESMDLRKEPHMLTPCNHIFHQACLEQWLDIKLVCPVCRAVLPDP
ncbi:hypothetical protein H696_04292 [Fonticula alba]|uniref:RING-type E3 ubiquitin transferase n=1 Tax=Fonticula alba TaxID=691883 RepID=A0A058Z3K5_FONAL|nr:hypothetical protein H696_04292 [Fonticula alba]KCV68874.1 hypothetical protein H696_04292 [Fonticula alba]|eukprot:XP_009496445.1 hypothetical protein H696_04292 [Fonticula alba]